MLERNKAIEADWAKYNHPVDRGGNKTGYKEGSLDWIAFKHGVTRGVVAGIAYRWRQRQRVQRQEPSKPRTINAAL